MFFKSIAGKFTAIAIGLIIFTAAVIGMLQSSQYIDYQLSYEKERLGYETQKASLSLQDFVRQAAQKALFLTKTPPTEYIADAANKGDGFLINGSSVAVWKQRQAQIMRALLDSNPEIDQIRLIQRAKNGQELIRVIRENGQIIAVPQSMLNTTGRGDYVVETLKLAPGEFHIAPLTHGIASNSSSDAVEPVPIVRISTPIYRNDWDVFGLIVIDVRASGVFAKLTNLTREGLALYLTNSSGEYLAYPKFRQTNTSTSAHPARIQDEYPVFASFFEKLNSPQSATDFDLLQSDNVIHLTKVPLEGSQTSQFLVVAAFSPLDRLIAANKANRNRILFVSGVLAIIGALLAFLAARFVTRPLKALKNATQTLSLGGDLDESYVPRWHDDEVGELAQAFYTMSVDLKTQQRHLREREAGIKEILQSATTPIITISKKGIIQEANDATTTLLGYSRGEMLGSNVSMLMAPYDRDRHDGYLNNYEKTQIRKMIGITREVEACRSDGTRVSISLAVSESSYNGEKIYTGIMTDLTEQKKSERLKNEFVSTVSHELRTPLTSIKGALGLVKSSVLGELPDQIKSMITIAYDNSDRLVRLINDILDMEKIEAGKISFSLQQIELGAFLERTILANKAYADNLDVSLKLGPVDHGLMVEADPDRLEQVITNLLSNAAKFSPSGAPVSITVMQREEMVRISVVDQGPGIPVEFQDTIFGKFAQADSSDTKSQGGTGLGLAISKAIVEAHGGTIGFQTSEGKGTTFFIDLPFEINAKYASGGVSGSTKPKILICEDDPDVSSLLALVIEEMGYDVETCISAETAIQRLFEEEFAAITVDLMLPGMDGITLIQKLREIPKTRELPILVVSASARKEKELATGSAFGVADWLEKPIDIKAFQRGIRRTVQSFKSNNLRILHIEDNPDHVKIVSSLIRSGDQIDIAHTCRRAKELLKLHEYNLVILDLVLPDGNGEDLLPYIHANDVNSPQVIVFSINELPKELSSKVSKALVKSQTSIDVLKQQIELFLGRKRQDVILDQTKNNFADLAEEFDGFDRT
ncbi:MAG: response regulator [Rhizobiales bacterium]|nr:response regulator [Hyphomicrobiales bacterium]